MTVDGKSYTQPLTLRLDPRVKLLPTDLTQLTSLTKEMYEGARSARRAYDQARALAAELEAQSGGDVDTFKQQLLAIAPAPPAGGRGGGGQRGGRGGTTPPTLDSISNAMIAAAMSMQAAEAPPTARDLKTCTQAKTDSATVLARWTKLKTTDLAALNAQRKAAGQPALTVPSNQR
jgi:hypothetical protein